MQSYKYFDTAPTAFVSVSLFGALDWRHHNWARLDWTMSRSRHRSKSPYMLNFHRSDEQIISWHLYVKNRSAF